MASRTPTTERGNGRARPPLRPAPARTNRPGAERSGRTTDSRTPSNPAAGGRSIGRQSAAVRDHRRDGRSLALGWGDHLTRAEKDQVKARLTFLGLSAVVAIALLLIGGTLAWDKVYQAQRAMLRVDGKTTTLKAYANLLSYERNRLELEFAQAQQLAGSPAQAGADPSQNFLAQYGQQRMQQIQSQLATITSTLPETILEEQLVRQEAAKRNITLTNEDVDKELKQLVGYEDPSASPAPTSAAGDTAEGTAQPTAAPTATPRRARQTDTFQARYKDYQRYTGSTDGVVRGQVEFQLLRRKLVEEMGKAVPQTVEQVHARHILVTDEAVAQTTLDRINAGEDFGALAAELSNDTSNKDNGGDLGWFGKGAMVKEFEEAVFALPVGQVSQPVKTSFGYHIIRVDEKDANRPLEGQALETAKGDAYRTWLESEKSSHHVERLLDANMIEWAEKNGRQPPSARRA
jgi:parvulin-like peptidyl-prolyl isomerase